MSPRIRVHTYPSEDATFGDSVTLEITVPDDQLLIAQVIANLQASYPGVAVQVAQEEGVDVAWHVYRDGLPA
jgi:hypothetical protein